MNHKLTLTFILGATLAANSLFAQAKREILEEDPKQSPNFKVELSPININTEFHTDVFVAIKSAYRWNNKFSISGEFKKELRDREIDQEEASGNPYSFHYGKPYRGFTCELIGTYYFGAKEKEVEDELPVKITHQGERTGISIDVLPMNRLALYGLRLGYGVRKGTNLLSETIREDADPDNELRDENVVPLQTTNVVIVGLSANRIKNVKIKYPVYGIRRRQSIVEGYFDILFATSNSFSKVQSTDGAKTEYTILESPKQKTGVRLGFFYTPTGKLINLGCGIEVGSFPGGNVKSAESYLNVKLLISLFKKAGLPKEE